MSALLLAAALACDEGSTSECEAASRDGKDDDMVGKALSHTAAGGVQDMVQRVL